MAEFRSSNFDDLVDEFDEGWGAYLHGNHQEPPAIVQAAADLPAGEQGRAILFSLIKTDLEGRWSEPRQDSGNIDRVYTDLPARGERGERLGRCPRLEDYAALFPHIGRVDQLPADLVDFEFWVRERYGLEAEFEKRFPDRNRFATVLTPDLPLPSRYEVVKQLGGGAFGTVYL